LVQRFVQNYNYPEAVLVME